MQEPRRLAARAAARRMAATLGEAVGETVGYRVRLDSKVGPRTRIEVVTDGLFLRMLQDDPVARGRRLRDLRRAARARAGDRSLLRAGARGAERAARGPAGDRHVGDARSRPGVGAAGRRADRRDRPAACFPVETRYLDREPMRPHRGRRGRARCAVRSAKKSGSALVFLPGVGEIRRVEERLRAALGARNRCRAALRRPVAGRAGPRHRPLARRPAQGRAGDLDRRDQPHHRGRAHRDRRRADARAALLAALGHDAAGDGAREPGLGRPAPRPRRPPASPASATGCGPRRRSAACCPSRRRRSSTPIWRRWRWNWPPGA